MSIKFLLTITGPPDAQGRQSFDVQWAGWYVGGDGKCRTGMRGQCGGGIIRETIARWDNDGNTCTIIDHKGYGLPIDDRVFLNKYMHKPTIKTRQLMLPIDTRSIQESDNA